MTPSECSSLRNEYLYLIGSEYIDSTLGNKCTLKDFIIVKNVSEKEQYMITCELMSTISGFIGSTILVTLEVFLHSGRFKRIRMAALS